MIGFARAACSKSLFGQPALNPEVLKIITGIRSVS